jgi:hypothetical protein
MTDKMIVFDDGFVYRVLNQNQAYTLIESNAMEVMAIDLDSMSEYAIEDIFSLNEAIDNGLAIGIEVGFIDDFVKRKNEKTVLINGSIYIKKSYEKD